VSSPAARRAVKRCCVFCVAALVATTLVGCAGGTVSTTLVVLFDSPTATAARAAVRQTCGSLPGISVVPPRSKDVNVYFDIEHATNIQVNALASCINTLNEQQPKLGIRSYSINDGTDS
jgi:hypothetical protein